MVRVLIPFMESIAQVFLMASHDSYHGVYLIMVYFTLILVLIFIPIFIHVELVIFISILRVFQIHDFAIH